MAYYTRRASRRVYRRPARRPTVSMYGRFSRAKRRRAPVRRKRAAPRRSAAGSRACACPSEISAGDRWSLAQLNPFNPRAFGGKIPDSNTVPSCAVALNDLVSLPLTVATNVNCWAFLPRVQRGRTIQATEGAASWTWAAAYGGNTSFSKATDYTAAYELDRPVAHGVRISSSVPPTTAQGFVHIAIAYESFANNGATTWPFPTTIAGLANYQFYKRVTLASLTQTPIVVVNKYMDETAFRYSDCSDVTGSGGAATGTLQTFHTFFSWGAILIAVEGVNSLSPINAEVLLHTEAIPKSTGAVSGTPAAVANGNLMGATSYMVANTGESFNGQEQDSYMARGAQAFQTGLEQAGNYARTELNRRARNYAQDLFANIVGGFVGAGAAGIGGVNNDPNRLALQN